MNDCYEPPEIAEASFPGTRQSPTWVRAWAREVLPELGAEGEPGENALLVLSELCANSVAHSRSGGPHGSYTVRLHQVRDRLRVEVTDAGGPTRPQARRKPGGGLGGLDEIEELLTESGRGLRLVEALTERWWPRTRGSCCTVTADIPLDGTEATSAQATAPAAAHGHTL